MGNDLMLPVRDQVADGAELVEFEGAEA